MNKAIALEMKSFSNPLLSIKGIGPVYAAGIFASIGNIKEFPSDDKIAKLAGLFGRENEAENLRQRKGASSVRLTAT